MKTTKNSLYTLLFCASGLYGFSQNLVINEAMDAKHISTGLGLIINTDTWTNANGGTVDLFDAGKSQKCRHDNGIPENYMGYQSSFAAGHNYAGIIAYYDDGANNAEDSMMNAKLGLKDGYKKFSEYLQGELSAPLVAGQVYQVSFRVSLAEKSGRAVSGLGALITKEKVNQASNSFLQMQPQFISYRIIADTGSWVTLYGAYIAEGGEKFITVGCFKDEYFSAVKTVGPNQNDSRKAYYYVSDVSVASYISNPQMDPIVLGVDYVELMDLQFDLASSSIAPKFYNELDGVASWMTKHPEMSFFIAGYTDKSGSKEVNDPLSVKRANAVKSYLASKGVKNENLITEGFGSKNPIEYKIKSRRNRRVEVYLYSANAVSQN